MSEKWKKKIENKLEMMDVEIESLIVSGDMKEEIMEALDKIGIVIYKLYNTIKRMIEE